MISVLFVDDEESIRDICPMYLERKGYFAVDTAESAKEAMQMLARKQYDCIVSDYQMPVMDGIAFLQALRASGDMTPFIIFTGKGREEVVIQAFESGADFYIQKGGEPRSQFAELEHKIGKAVQSRSDQHALQESRERLELVIEGSEAGTWDWWLETGAVAVNDRWAAMIGYTPDELSPVTRDTLLSFYYPEDRDRSIALIGRHFSGELPVYECEARMVHRDGHLVWVVDRGRVVERTGDGRPVRMAGTRFDITGRKEVKHEVERLLAELQLHQTELEIQNEELTRSREALESVLKRYHDLYTLAPVALFTLAHDGTIEYVNPAGAALLGMRTGELEGRRFGLFVTGDARPQFNAFLGSVFLRHEADPVDLAIEARGSGPVLVRARAALSPPGDACFLVLVPAYDMPGHGVPLHTMQVSPGRQEGREEAHQGVNLDGTGRVER